MSVQVVVTFSDAAVAWIDDFRRRENPIPPRAEVVRRAFEAGCEAIEPKRYEGAAEPADPWLEPLRAWLAARPDEAITVRDALREAVGLADPDRTESIRGAALIRKLGWVVSVKRRKGDDTRIRLYVRGKFANARAPETIAQRT